MNRPIVLIDDDEDDIDMVRQALISLQCDNELIAFKSAPEFLNFIRTTNKNLLFILCDINMNSVNGLQLKKQICEDDRLRLKCIPFLFWSTSSSENSIEEAYSYQVQGYFVKPNDLNALKDMINSMLIYWQYSKHPNS